MTRDDYNSLDLFYASDLGVKTRVEFSKYIAKFYDGAEGLDVPLALGYGAAFAPIGYRGIEINGGEVANLSFLGNFQNLPLPNASADQILSLHALEYNDQPNKVIAEFWRVLKPEGYALFFIPSDQSSWHENALSPWRCKGMKVHKIKNLLLAQRFEICAEDEMLFLPPTQNRFTLKFFCFFECLGRYLPINPAVHVIKVRKKIYGSVAQDKEKAFVKPLVGAPVKPSSSRSRRFKVD